MAVVAASRAQIHCPARAARMRGPACIPTVFDRLVFATGIGDGSEQP
jgi:hypothetical protein